MPAGIDHFSSGQGSLIQREDSVACDFEYRVQSPFDPSKLYRFVKQHFNLRQAPHWEQEGSEKSNGGGEETASPRCAAQKAAEAAHEAAMTADRAIHGYAQCLKMSASIPSDNVMDHGLSSALVSAAASLRAASETLQQLLLVVDGKVEAQREDGANHKKIYSDSEIGDIHSSEGVVWLSTRPTMRGSWYQQENTLWLTWEGPWRSAALKGKCLKTHRRHEIDETKIESGSKDNKKAFPMSMTDDLGCAEIDLDDRYQHLKFWGEGIQKDKLKEMLDACLVNESYDLKEPDNDPFDPWPGIEELKMIGDDESVTTTMHEDSAEEEAVRDPAEVDIHQEPRARAILDENPCGCVLRISDGASEAQRVLDELATGALLVIHWLGPWARPSQEASEAFRQLADAFPSIPMMEVNVEDSYANRAFALEKTMTRGESARPDAKLVLKNSKRWPCFTIHRAPYLQPREMELTGDCAVEELADMIQSERTLPENESSTWKAIASSVNHSACDENPLEETASPGQPAVLQEEDKESMQLTQVSKFAGGPGEFKRVLKDSGGKTVMVLWVDSSKQASPNPMQDASGADGFDARSNTDSKGFKLPVYMNYLESLSNRLVLERRNDCVVLVLADIAAETSTLTLAKGLKISRCPTLDVYKSMKLVRRIHYDGQSSDKTLSEVTLFQLTLEVLGIAHDKSQQNQMDGNDIKNPSMSDASDAQSEYDPPKGKYAKPGLVKKRANGEEAHFFPKMPCLRCGCPWWTSDEWHGKCIRCGWDCERTGYDDESRPLPAYRRTWEIFTKAIRDGKSPPWKNPVHGGHATQKSCA